ncbi:reverse transcriptase [Gossypium australe]|uniref:Reverse transcriptase n=1 Tax=Gossypium australe TaxID=47621 RepID=A0A5B6WGV0_9ROSI|nr:reverse transcriptase [Gossypium australe]
MITLYGCKCRIPLYWTELSENKLHGVDLIKDTEQKVKVIRDSLKSASDRQKYYADSKRKDIEFEIGDKCLSERKCFDSNAKASLVRDSVDHIKLLNVLDQLHTNCCCHLN